MDPYTWSHLHRSIWTTLRSPAIIQHLVYLYYPFNINVKLNLGQPEPTVDATFNLRILDNYILDFVSYPVEIV